jgi:N-acetylglucosaminyldiphosphoundecaprenol N-acetyl-beta-D-mannosaminyltransferase
MIKTSSRTVDKEEVGRLYKRFRRVVLASSANQLTKYQTGELNREVRALIHQETQQLYQQLRTVVFTSSLRNVKQIQLPSRIKAGDAEALSSEALSSEADSSEAHCQGTRKIHQEFRQAVLISSANVLRQKAAASLQESVQETVKILNVEIDNLSKHDFLSKLSHGVVFTPNVDHLMKLQHDPEFMAAYQQADYRVCDSQILIYASRFLGKPIKAKISGSDLFPMFCEHHKDKGQTKIFLLGGAEGIAKQAQQRINERIGRNIIIAAHSPSFGFEKNQQECQYIVDLINRSPANVLVVGVGAPKQEIWISQYRPLLPKISIFLAVGAAIDFEAGNKPRAPKLMSDLGIEWLYRLVTEPKRLWKRYLIDDLPFITLVLKQKLQETWRSMVQLDKSNAKT